MLRRFIVFSFDHELRTRAVAADKGRTMVPTSFPEIGAEHILQSLTPVVAPSGRSAQTYHARLLRVELQRFDHGSANGGNRRISPVALSHGGGLLTEPTSAVQRW